LIELVITSIISVIIILSAGVLLVGGNRAWQKTYNSANKKMKLDADAITIAFGSMGRRANRLNYFIYKLNGGVFTPAAPQTANEEVVSGNAVEFRYWDVELDKTDSHDLMDVAKMATAYALFYLDGDKMKVDYGPYPPGAVPAGGGGRNTAGVRTIVLAEDVSADPNSDASPFSHTTVSKVGQGSVRINCLLTDPDDGEIINVKTSTFLRNIWPR
jgi:hypothetical protein